MDNNGNYNFYSGKAENPVGKHSAYNFDFDEYIGIIKGGGAGQGKYGNQIGLGKSFYLCGKNALSNGLYILKVKNISILTKYIYHYLIQQKNNIMDLATYTTGLGNIKQESLKNFLIGIPSIEIQQMIVKQLDLLSENNASCKKQIEESKQILKDYVKCMTLWDEEKKFNDICDIDTYKKHETDYGKTVGKYRFHTGGASTELYCDNYDINELCIIQNRTNGSGKCNLTIDKQFSCAKQTIIYRAKNDDNNTTTKYIYYYLVANLKILENGYKGSNHKNISKDYIENISIPIPSLEKQKEIVAYCNEIEETIKLLEKRITSNEQLMKQILDTYLKVREQVNEEVNNVIDVKENEQTDEPVEETPKKKVAVKKVIKKNPLCSKVESTDDI